MRHRQIEAFQSVMIAGSITGGAKLLNISQPSVSRLIGDLEHSLGFTLFERKHGKVMPTAKAIRFFEEVERSFQGLDRLLRFAQGLGDLRDAQLTIGAMPALCLDLIPNAVSTLIQQYPSLSVTLEARSSERIVDWVASQRCDLGLAAPPYNIRGVECEFSVTTQCVIVAPRDHPLADRSEITAGDLRGERLILLADSIVRHQTLATLGSSGVEPIDHMETTLSVVACRLVEENLGIALVEPYTARFFGSERLAVRPFKPTIPFRFGLLSPVGKSRPREARDLAEHLRDTIQSLELPGGASAVVDGALQIP